MKDTHVIIPLSKFDELQKEFDAINDISMDSAMKKANILGKLQMFYDPEFIRFNAKGDISLLSNANYFLHLEENKNTIGIDLSKIDEDEK